MGGFVSAMSYSATTYSAFMMIGLAGLTYTGGVGALGFELIYLIGVTLVLVFGPRFWLVGKKFGYVTPTEMLGHRYGTRSVAVVTAVTTPSLTVFVLPSIIHMLFAAGAFLVRDRPQRIERNPAGRVISYACGFGMFVFLQVASYFKP